MLWYETKKIMIGGLLQPRQSPAFDIERDILPAKSGLTASPCEPALRIATPYISILLLAGLKDALKARGSSWSYLLKEIPKSSLKNLEPSISNPPPPTLIKVTTDSHIKDADN